MWRLPLVGCALIGGFVVLLMISNLHIDGVRIGGHSSANNGAETRQPDDKGGIVAGSAEDQRPGGSHPQAKDSQATPAAQTPAQQQAPAPPAGPPAPPPAVQAPIPAVPAAPASPPASNADTKGNRIAQLSDADVSSTGSMPDLTRNVSHSAWQIFTTADLAQSDPIIDGWLKKLADPAPKLWPTFPNIPNPLVQGFRVVNRNEVPDGVEYGVPNVPFCQQDMRCDYIVPARHYRLETGDYVYRGTRCAGGGGCLLLVFNEGGESHTDVNQYFDNGFTVPGRYWNGDTLEWGAWGLVSHASANMLNLPTKASEDKVLNPGGNSANGGANCGVPEACNSVRAMIVVKTGDKVKAVAKTSINVDSSVAGWN